MGLYPIGLSDATAEIFSMEGMILPLGLARNGGLLTVAYLMQDGTIAHRTWQGRCGTDKVTRLTFLARQFDTRMEWHKGFMFLGALSSTSTPLVSLVDALIFARVEEVFNLEIQVAKQNSLTEEVVYSNLVRPQPENPPLVDGNFQRATKAKDQTMGFGTPATARKPATSTSARKPVTEQNKATGIAKGHEFDNASELGLKQVQVWPASESKNGFLGFATLLYHDMTIRDIVVREAGEKSRNPGAIYAGMPAKKTNNPSRPYQELAYFNAEKEGEPNKRETLNAMVELAYLRATGQEPALDESGNDKK